MEPWCTPQKITVEKLKPNEQSPWRCARLVYGRGHLGSGGVAAAAQAEGGDVELHGVDDGEAAVPVLLGDHHGEPALWCLGDDVTG